MFQGYVAGRDDTVLKWKPDSHNSIDFKLNVVRENKMGMLPETNGYLYVGGQPEPFGVMPKLKKELRELNNKIIECTFDKTTNQWVFMRERTDKSYPNGKNTALGVMRSIQQPVTTDMLLDFIERFQFKRPNPSHPGGQQPGPSSSGMPPPPKMPKTQ